MREGASRLVRAFSMCPKNHTSREPMAVSARNGNRSAGAIAVSASSQMAECWHPIAMATRFFRSKVLLSMEIDAVASRTPEC